MSSIVLEKGRSIKVWPVTLLKTEVPLTSVYSGKCIFMTQHDKEMILLAAFVKDQPLKLPAMEESKGGKGDGKNRLSLVSHSLTFLTLDISHIICKEVIYAHNIFHRCELCIP